MPSRLSAHPPSLILSTAPPPTVLWVGALAARRLGVAHIVDLRDPWTDAVDLRPRGSIEQALARKIEQPGIVFEVEVLPALRIARRQIAQMRAGQFIRVRGNRAPFA